MLAAAITLGWAAPALLVGLSAYIALANWIILVSGAITGRRASVVVLIGSVLGVVGLLLLPTLRRWAWVPLVADPGMLVLVLGLPGLVSGLCQTASFNRVGAYEATRHGEVVRLDLYRGGLLVYKWRTGGPETTELSLVGEWSRAGDRLEFRLLGRTVVMEAVAPVPTETLRPTADPATAGGFPDPWSAATGFASIESDPHPRRGLTDADPADHSS